MTKLFFLSETTSTLDIIHIKIDFNFDMVHDFILECLYMMFSFTYAKKIENCQLVSIMQSFVHLFDKTCS